jgi:hypothetical protein
MYWFSLESQSYIYVKRERPLQTNPEKYFRNSSLTASFWKLREHFNMQVSSSLLRINGSKAEEEKQATRYF